MLDWEGTETAQILAGEDTAGPVASSLREADAVLAWTRSPSLVAALTPKVKRIVVQDPTPAPGSGHVSAWLARPLSELGIPPLAEAPLLQFTDAEHRACSGTARLLRPGFLALHAGSGSTAKNWPRERFVALAESLAGDQPWLLVTGPAEAAVSREPKTAVVARGLPLRVLGALLSRAGIYVGNDSGITHLAAAAGTRTLALFGPTDPATWAPLGRRVLTLRAPRGELDRLSVDAVLQQARRFAAT